MTGPQLHPPIPWGPVVGDLPAVEDPHGFYVIERTIAGYRAVCRCGATSGTTNDQLRPNTPTDADRAQQAHQEEARS